jgi:hypothetical protein
MIELIKTIFTKKQIAKIKYDVKEGVPLNSIGSGFKDLSRSNRAVLFAYLRSLRYPYAYGASSGMLGHRDEPYHKKESDIGKIPTYSWDTLTKKEKIFYETREKNGQRMD